MATIEDARAALEWLERNAVAPLPPAYEVWLAYVLGEPEHLKREIDTAITDGTNVDSALTSKLYDRFFSTRPLTSAVIETGARLSGEMTTLSTTLRDVATETEAFGLSLRGAAQHLDRATNIQSIKVLVDGLSQETERLSVRNRQLASSFEAATSEIERLRENLEAARIASLTDPLTGLANRKLFEDTLAARWKEATDSGTQLCLAMCDIDHFKRFNDTWGHQTGDQIIRFVSTVLRNHLPEQCLIARYGGEEFCVVMTDMEPKAAFDGLEACRRTIESKRLLRRTTQQELGTVTVSFGLAALRPGETAEDLIDRADNALYHSKRTGRNRSTFAPAISLVAGAA